MIEVGVRTAFRSKGGGSKIAVTAGVEGYF